MKYIIFYSWQSDLPNNTNRGFIETVIERAINDIRANEDYELEPSIDRDTQGVPGSPNITNTILKKIRTCDAFVADISIVTGNKENGQRLSPNPNVLLELGYAISLLGWDKIILFCNDVYGTNEDLPFDIRQHRRIEYSLLPDDTKSGTRKSLSSHFKGRLVELIKKGKTNSTDKQPILSIAWNCLDLNEDIESSEGKITDIINLPRIKHILNLDKEVENQIIDAKNIDGSQDPDWNEKLKNYTNKANEFIKDIQDKSKYHDYLITSNLDKTNPTTLSVKNTGNAKASDVRVDIFLPDWLLAFERLEDMKHNITKPKVPTPSRPRASTAFSSIANTMASLDAYSPTLISRNTKLTSACTLKNGDIFFWADDLLHKHSITDMSDSFYLMAMPDAPVGEVILKGQAFCSEYEDWQDIELSINIVK